MKFGIATTRKTGNTAGCFHERIIRWWDKYLATWVEFCLDCSSVINSED